MTAKEERDEVLGRHKRVIIDGCRSRLDTLGALVLYGGYGRGEGSWYRDEDGWHPYNDYDLIAVVKHKVSQETVKQLRTDLAVEVGIQWVDLGQKTRRQLTHLKPSIYNYDLKYASTVIYGDPAILGVIPPMDPTRLPLREALTLFITRLWTFLGSLDEAGLGQDLTGEDARFFRNQMAKALLAAVDAALLMKGGYDASYRLRMERVQSLYALSERRQQLFQWALDEKLRPQELEMGAEEVETLYDDVHGIFRSFMLEALSRYFGRTLYQIEDIVKNYRQHWSTLLKRILYPVARRSMRHERVVKVNLAQMYIFGAYRPGEDINDRLLAKGCALLKRLDPDLSDKMSWDQARLAAAALRMSV